MTLSAETLTILVLVAIGLAVLALFLLTVSSPGRRASSGGASRQLHGATAELVEANARLQEALSLVIQRVGLIRYDAFEDMGGRLSFSLALLDARGDGVVVTSINGRQDTRCYAKPVSGGASSFNLSEEEVEAIAQAMGSEPAVTAK